MYNRRPVDVVCSRGDARQWVRESLERRLRQRPSVHDLLTRNIVKGARAAPNADYLVNRDLVQQR